MHWCRLELRLRAFGLLPEGQALASVAPEQRQQLEAQLGQRELDHKIALAVHKPNGAPCLCRPSPPLAGPCASAKPACLPLRPASRRHCAHLQKLGSSPLQPTPCAAAVLRRPRTAYNLFTHDRMGRLMAQGAQGDVIARMAGGFQWAWGARLTGGVGELGRSEQARLGSRLPFSVWRRAPCVLTCVPRRDVA